ncbi:MAG TPA: isoprenylcysteine carboxylmethyltransferase family protein [Polyangiaceae bacterium]|nr:isoprenylcysteine carboxylmethyltransferase family protein [Polyangiaceae bacterium]
MMVRALGIVAYAAFNAAFLYFIGFTLGVVVPRTVDSAGDTAPLLAFAVDASLIAFFGVVHSVMARAGFKQGLSRILPRSAERPLYVLVASLQLALVCWQWQPVGGVVWSVGGGLGTLLLVLSALGWGLVLASSYSIDHFELFGLKQAFGRAAPAPVFRVPFLYRIVRHPLYLGILVGLWVAPVMTGSHLLLAALFTVYILVGVQHEERDLVRVFGDEYRRYRAAVPMLLPFPRPGRGVPEVRLT